MIKKKVYNPHWTYKNKPFEGLKHNTTLFDERNQVFYNCTDWRNLSKRKLKDSPLCVMCKAKNIIQPAECVDHIININDDWDLRLDYDNLQSLCNSCHMKKENEYRKQKRIEERKKVTKMVMDDLNDFD